MARRTLTFESFDQVNEDVRRLLDGDYDRAGKWDLGQVCKHLALAVSASTMGKPAPASTWLVRTFLGPYWRRRAIRTSSLPDNMPTPAAMAPKEGTPPQRAAKQLANAFGRFDEHDGPWSVHPFLGKLDKDQWRQFHLIHCAHHLGFLVPRNGEPAPTEADQR